MIQVGRFAIFGDWDDSATPEGMIRIVMPPLGHVFGAGWMIHTQIALLCLPEHVRPGITFLEIGAGSGILSVAASKLGAARCIATELDREALKLLPVVFKLNGVDAEVVDGTFIDEHVDLAVVSVSSNFWNENRHLVHADQIIVIHDDGSAEVVA